MNFKKIFHHKVLYGLLNFIFLSCGITLLIIGLCLYLDTSRQLLSRLLGAGSEQLADLQQPIFYYVAIGFSGAGMIAIFASLIGWWAACLNTYWILSCHFLLILFLLIIELGVCLMITLWPQCLGLSLDEMGMVKILQGNYGVPGKEQFTAAMDLAQTQFNCCAINSNINYDTSLWKLQEYGQKDWPVPLTCCHLINRNEANAFLDPKPINISICESLEKYEYDRGRHIEGCFNKIDLWYRQHYVILLGSILVVAIIEFCVLLTIILNCTQLTSQSIKSNPQNRIAHTQQRDNNSNNKPDVTRKETRNTENIYMESRQNINNIESIEESNRDRFVEPMELRRNNYSTTFRPISRYQYQVSKSYLV